MMINLVLITGLLLLVAGIISFSWNSSFSLLVGILVIILILRNIYQSERLENLERKLDELTKGKSASQPDLRSSKAVQPGQQEIQQPGTAEQLKTVPNVKESVRKESEYEFAEQSRKVTPLESRQGNFDIVSIIKSWMMTGNPIAKIGILILFIGVAFLLKYAAEHVGMSIELRLAGVFLLGFVMVGIGWRLSAARRDFASILQGGGVGLMYLAVYAAFAIYNLLPYTGALSLLILIVIMTGVISILRNAKAIAVTAILGGFLAPVLIATGPYHYVFMFTYYLVLNMSILGISWFKSWRDLNLIGFIFTFILSALWGWQSYQQEYLFSTELFLILFFLFYIAISILFTFHQESGSKNIVDSVITFGTPTVVLILQSALMKDINYGLAWSAFSFMVFYAVLAFILFAVNANTFKVLSSAFVAIAVMFGTITIPLTFTGIWISSDWALESIVMLWFGVRQQQVLPRLAAGIILIASTVLFIIHSQEANIIQPFFNEYYLSGLFIVFACLICSYFFYSVREKGSESEYSFAVIFFILGFIGWYYLNLQHIYDYLSINQQFITILLFLTSTSLIAWILSEALGWHWLRYPAIALLPMMAVLSIPVYPYDYYHPSGSLPSWLLCFIAFYSILYRHEKYPREYLSGLHLCVFLFLTWFIADRLDVFLRQRNDIPFTWSFIAWVAVPTLMLYLVGLGRKRLIWPLAKYESSYWYASGSMFVVFILLWFLISNFLPGNVYPFVYIPLLNPLDIAIGLALVAAVIWVRSANEWLYHTIENVSLRQVLEIGSIVFFIWMTAVLLRTLHQWLLIPYDWDSLWHSMVVQGSLSIFWTVLALIETYIAARTNQRILWFLGFALIWVVIFKLFLVDLSGTNTIERIVTFIGVGLLLLINGYISPLPPKEK
jgi:uncharacterized membrane protein